MAVRILADDRNRDDVVMVVENEQELEFLIAYRKANAAGKRRFEKFGCAIRDGLFRNGLMTHEKINAMTTAEKIAFVDALPEAHP